MAVELEFEGRFNGQEFRQADSGPVPWHTAATGLGSCHCLSVLLRVSACLAWEGARGVITKCIFGCCVSHLRLYLFHLHR